MRRHPGALVLDEGSRAAAAFRHDELAPVIAVKSACMTEARTLSYMHQYPHLARGSGSICARVPNSRVEQECKRSAATFLVPVVV